MATKKKATKKKTKKKAVKRKPDVVRLMTMEELSKDWKFDGNVLRHPTKKGISIDLMHDCLEELCLGDTLPYNETYGVQKDMIAEEVYKEYTFVTDGGEDVQILGDGSIKAPCGEDILRKEESRKVYDVLHKIFGQKTVSKKAKK